MIDGFSSHPSKQLVVRPNTGFCFHAFLMTCIFLTHSSHNCFDTSRLHVLKSTSNDFFIPYCAHHSPTAWSHLPWYLSTGTDVDITAIITGGVWFDIKCSLDMLNGCPWPIGDNNSMHNYVRKDDAVHLEGAKANGTLSLNAFPNCPRDGPCAIPQLCSMFHND